jgi:hypothetical protein
MIEMLAAWKNTDQIDEARQAALVAPGSLEETARLGIVGTDMDGHPIIHSILIRCLSPEFAHSPD